MSLPAVNITIQDGGLGIVPSVPSNASIKLGVCSGGLVNSLYGFSSIPVMEATLGQGETIESAAKTLSDSGGPIFVMPTNPSVAGLVGTAAHVGSGLGTVTPSITPAVQITVVCTTGGTIGTAQFTAQLGTGPVSLPVLSLTAWLSAGWSNGWLVPGTMTHLRFSNGAGSFTALDSWVIDTLGVITAGGGNAGAGSITTQVSSPLDDYEVVVDIDTAGAIGAGVFKYSLDNGNTFSGTITIPGSAGKYALPNTGIMLTFANGGGAFVANDTYSFFAVAAGSTSSDFTAALTALQALQAPWGFLHIVATPATAAAAATLASAIDTALTTMQGAFQYGWALVQCPTVGSEIISGGAPIADTADTDSVVKAAFASFTSTRVAVCAGDADIASPITGGVMRRNCAWVVSSRAASVPVGQDLARVRTGPLAGVTKLYRDEFSTPALDAGRFTTLCTQLGKPGFYITNGRLMASPTSDFQLIQYRRVMDVACTVTRAVELDYLSDDVRVDPSTGYIDPRDADKFEGDVKDALDNALIATGDASAASVQMSRTTDVIATGSEPVTVLVTPKAYLKNIATTIGFFNPAQQ